MTKSKVIIFQWRWLFPLFCVLVFHHSVSAQHWTQKADMVNPRLFFSVVAVEEEIYVVGGMLAAPMDSVEAYLPETDKWHQKASLPTPRAGVAACVVDGKIYAIGGWDGGNPAVGTVTQYDPGTDTWTPKAEMPTPRSFFAAVAVDRLIYTFGGVAENVGPVLATMEVYDTRTDTWTQKAEMPQRGKPSKWIREQLTANPDTLISWQDDKINHIDPVFEYPHWGQVIDYILNNL